MDLDHNGLRNQNDSLLSDIVIFIFNKFNIFVKSVKSDQYGRYSAKNLDADQYYCKVPVYDDKDFVKFTGSNPDIDSEITNQYGEGTSRLVTLSAGAPISNFDFGYRIKGLKKIAAQTEHSGLHIFPNPSFWFINVNLPTKENADYYIINHTGAIIQKGIILEGSGRISIEELNTGKYTIIVLYDKTILSKSFMKIEN
ncbi:MAG: T9SS type A sorting domain-containing protein [Saprospiraceae bacterium]|nr:T9SS type A sorting domain-containing protein [Saprospiraceae bacterium]